MKKLFLILLGLVLVVIAAALVLPFLVPTETYKAELTERVESVTGRRLTIEGPLEITLLPRLSLRAEGVRFANAEGSAEPDMARLKVLAVELKIWPLLRGTVAVDRFVLVEPVIHLEIDDSGRPNWQLGGARAGTGAGTDAEADGAPSAGQGGGASGGGGGGGGLPLAELELGEVSLENGTITYTDRRSGISERVEAIDVSLGLPDLKSLLTVDGSLVYEGRAIELDLTLESPIDLLQGAGTPVSAKITAELLDLEFDGVVGAGDAPGASGQLDLEVASLRQLAAWLAEPIALEGEGLERLRITGQLDATADQIVLTDGSFEVDDIQANGELRVDLAGRVPRIGGRLDIGAIDVNRYLPPAAAPGDEPVAGAGAAAGTPPAAPANRGKQAKAGVKIEVAAEPPTGADGDQPRAGARAGWSDAPIVLPPLDAVEVDFELSVGSLLVEELKLGQTRLRVTLQGGRLVVDLLEMTLYGGQGQGRLEYELVDGQPTVAETFALEGLDALPFLTDAIGFDRLEGTVGVEVELRSWGDTERRLIRNLAGRGRVAFADGAIVGVNLAAMVRNVASAFRGGTPGEALRTDFAELGGSFTVERGIVDNADMRLLAPLLRLAGAGRIHLPKRRINYRVEPKAVATLEGQGGGRDLAGLLVPVNIKGPWDDLSFTPDLSSLVQQALENPEKLQRVIEELGDLDKKQLKDAAKALLGGDDDDDADVNPAKRLLQGLFGR